MSTDRLSTGDRVYLAMDRGPVPHQFAAILVLDPDPGFDLAAARRILAQRLGSVPRLRQRLASGPGPPAWVEDPRFDPADQIGQVACPSPGDERALLDLATSLVTTPIPRTGPLWRAVFVTGLADGGTACVIVVRHVLADGIGGLAILASLADGARPAPVAAPSRPHNAAGWRSFRQSMAAGGGWRPAPAAACSLVHRTGPARRLAVVPANLAAVRASAHPVGATVNDAVLTAVGAALSAVLAHRGESADCIAVAVPVAGRRSASTAELGNQVAPMLVTVPAGGDPMDRLRAVAAAVRARKSAATGPAPIEVIGPLFRAFAAVGGYRWYMNHQRRMHTLVSHLHGPEQPVSLAGARVRTIIPVAVGEAGNITVTFAVLSYAGTLTITAVADPAHFPDLPVLTEALQHQLALLTRR